MPHGYEINDLAKEESWRMFRIIGELVEGFDRLSGVEPAITIYGSARVKPGDPLYETTVEIARELGKLGFAIVTGGGPGLMEAANKGAHLAGITSVGLNIDLPQEQVPNPYSTLTITFNHFFARKVMLAKYATAFIAMPGGIGTLDELTEIVCLIQTHKMRPFPVILFGSAYWGGLLSWLRTTMLSGGFISREDLDLIVVCDQVSEVVKTVKEWYDRQELSATEPLDPSRCRPGKSVTAGAHENGPK
ncbi:MAG: TIGR00730 family Rossman fold protein [Dehalococcoidia bacterium]|nr:MAG: TIGR00730 family Rossman fold protein [Dehalococcoidia bacterium]